MMDTFEKGHAIPFITYVKGKGFALSQEAEDVLNSFKDEQLGVVSIAGKYRTGKSFFVNRVLLNARNDGFTVGPTINPCTKGLWLWSKTLQSENPEYPNMKILLVDTEGFAGTDENTTHDTRIFIFALLLSSFFIYNSVGNIDESALNNLSLIINLAKEIQTKSQEGHTEGGDDIAQYFPAFLWVVRDFALKLVDHNGNPISSKEYLENALKPQKGVSDSAESKNRIRRMFTHFFRDRDCCTMVRPLESEKHLQRLDEIPDAELRPEFVDQMKNVRKRIFKKVKPKTMNGQNLNGGMLLEVIKAYIDAINTGKAPNVESAWTYLCKQESHKALEASVETVDRRLDHEQRKDPLDEEELKNIQKELREEMMSTFKKKSIGDSEEIKDLYQELESQFEAKFAKFKERNAEKWKDALSNWIEANSTVETKLKDYQYNNFYEFKNELEQMKATYDKEAPKGVNKELFWSEYSQRMYILAAEAISKKTEEQYSMQNLRLTQRLEMTETELNSKRKEYETERNSLYNKIQEIERERAFFKAQESGINEKVEGLKKDKEKYERLYNELLEASKQREDKIIKESKERINELEQKLEDLRRESSTKNADLEKNSALLEQESQFIKRDNDSLKTKVSAMEQERERFITSNRQKDEMIEEYKRKISELELTKQHETSELRRDLERRTSDLQMEEDKRKESVKHQSEWLIEKSYLENQVGFLKSQLEENKRLHDALLLALEQGLNGNDNEGTNELVETNRNLSAAVDKMEMRCKILEEKIEKLKRYKRMVKNSSALQCVHCSKFISSNVFLQHTTNCSNPQAATTPNKPNIITPLSGTNQWHAGNDIDPNALQISINQTMVKENSDSKPYTEYLIQVVYNGMKWSVSRKYKMFCELHQSLNTQFPSLKFPESAFTILGAFNNINYISNSKRPTVIEERRKALQQYLRDLSKLDIVRNSSPFKKFLELDRVFEHEVTNNAQNTRMANQMPSNLISNREERRETTNSGTDRNPVKNEDIYGAHPTYQGQRNGDTSNNYGASSQYNDSSMGQRGSDVKIDKNMFSQSPLSFMKNWQEKAINKENKNPSRSRSAIDNANLLAQNGGGQIAEGDTDRNDNVSELSNLSLRINPEVYSANISHDKSTNQSSKIDASNQRYSPPSSNQSTIKNAPSSAYSQATALLYPPSNGISHKSTTGRATHSGRNSINQYDGDLNSIISSKYQGGRSLYN